MFPNLQEVGLYMRRLWDTAAHSSLVTRTICYRGASYVGCVGPSVVVGPTTVGILAQLAARVCLEWWLPAHWGMWLGPGMTDCEARGALSWCWPAGGWGRV